MVVLDEEDGPVVEVPGGQGEGEEQLGPPLDPLGPPHPGGGPGGATQGLPGGGEDGGIPPWPRSPE